MSYPTNNVYKEFKFLNLKCIYYNNFILHIIKVDANLFMSLYMNIIHA